MTLTAYGKPYTSSAMLTSGTTDIYQDFKFEVNKKLRGVRAWVIGIGAPTFTNLKMQIYSNDENAATNTPATLLYTSTNSYANWAAIASEDHALAEIYFTFNDVPLRRATYYHALLRADSYSGVSDTSHLSWKQNEDPFYTVTGKSSFSTNDIEILPLDLVFIGAKQ